MSNNNEEEKRAIELLRQRKYQVRKLGRTMQATIYVDINTWQEFRKYSKELDYFLRDSVTEALDLWLEAKKQEIESLKKK